MTNPLLDTWQTPFGLPPFDTISDDHFEPAMQAAIKAARAGEASVNSRSRTSVTLAR